MPVHHDHNDREEYDCYLGESLECPLVPPCPIMTEN